MYQEVGIVRQDPDGPNVGLMNFAIWVVMINANFDVTGGTGGCYWGNLPFTAVTTKLASNTPVGVFHRSPSSGSSYFDSFLCALDMIENTSEGERDMILLGDLLNYDYVINESLNF